MPEFIKVSPFALSSKKKLAIIRVFIKCIPFGQFIREIPEITDSNETQQWMTENVGSKDTDRGFNLCGTQEQAVTIGSNIILIRQFLPPCVDCVATR